MRNHYTYCPKCCYFNDTCDCSCPEHQWNHAGIEHDNCANPTNAWPKMNTTAEEVTQ